MVEGKCCVIAAVFKNKITSVRCKEQSLKKKNPKKFGTSQGDELAVVFSFVLQ